jgi:hypothetical protein
MSATAHQQGCSVIGRQDIQADRRRVLKRGEVATAGHQDQARIGTGQQRTHLLAVGGVIENQQEPLAGQPAPPGRRAALQAGRDLPGRHARGEQQRSERVGGLGLGLAGSVPVQRQEDLAIGEPLREQVRRAHHEGGLADSGHAADRVYPGELARLRYRIHEDTQVRVAAGEAGDVAGQRSRCRGFTYRGPCSRPPATGGGPEPRARRTHPPGVRKPHRDPGPTTSGRSEARGALRPRP